MGSNLIDKKFQTRKWSEKKKIWIKIDIKLNQILRNEIVKTKYIVIKILKNKFDIINKK